MKSLLEYIIGKTDREADRKVDVNEAAGQPLDDDWLNNEKPVMTHDKRQAIILDIDISKVPNVIIGKVKVGDKLCDYKWDDTGHCTYSTDEHGNPTWPSKEDDLVKGA